MEPIYEKWLQNPGPERGYAVYSFAVLGRNLRDIPFAFHADAPQREEIREKIRKVISQSELAHVLYAVPLLRCWPAGGPARHRLCLCLRLVRHAGV